MAVKKTNRKYTKGINPSQPVLGLYKDATTNKFTAFDDNGGIEEISSSVTIDNIQPIVSSNSVSVSLNTSALTDTTLDSVTINSKQGYIEFSLDNNIIGSGTTITIPVNNNLVNSNSIILFSLEDVQTTGSANNNKGFLLNANQKTEGSFNLTICSIWSINLSSATNYIQAGAIKINFLIL